MARPLTAADRVPQVGESFPRIEESGGCLIVVFQEKPNVEARLYEPSEMFFRDSKQGKVSYSLGSLSVTDAYGFAGSITEAACLAFDWEAGNITKAELLKRYGA